MKAMIVGIGKTGSTIAFVLADSSKFEEITLIDIDKDLALGEATDISHAIVDTNNALVKAGEYSDGANSDYVIITAGKPRSKDMTRDDLFDINYTIVKDVVQQCSKFSPDAKYLIVTNPVDKICKHLGRDDCFPDGNLVDTMRFVSILSKTNSMNTACDAYVTGEHNENMVLHYPEYIDEDPKITRLVKETGAFLNKTKRGSSWVVGKAVLEMIESRMVKKGGRGK